MSRRLQLPQRLIDSLIHGDGGLKLCQLNVDTDGAFVLSSSASVGSSPRDLSLRLHWCPAMQLNQSNPDEFGELSGAPPGAKGTNIKTSALFDPKVIQNKSRVHQKALLKCFQMIKHG